MSKSRKFSGKTWIFADNVDTDQIIPAEYLITGNPKELAEHAFEKVRPEFAKNVEAGDIIVAGENFGCGSSREHAPRALLGAGVSAVVAKSFARIFFRNSINIGLPVITCSISAEEGDKIEIEFEKGTIKNLGSGKVFKFKPLPKFLTELMESGGLTEYTKKRVLKK